MLARESLEHQYVRTFEKFGYGTTIWSPLCSGVLTGKYNNGKMPENSRFSRSSIFKMLGYDKYMGEGKDTIFDVLNSIKDIADDLGCKMAELALAWTLVNKDVSTCIFGASNVSQLESNLKAVEIAANWSIELEERINKVLDNEPV